MKAFVRTFFIAVCILPAVINAQRVSVFAGGGVSSYYGDLVQGTPLVKNLKPAVTLGGSYDFTPKLRMRLSLTGLGVQASDQDNEREDFKQRNLSFSSFIWEANVAAEYDFLNNFDEWAFTPYVFFGPGVFGFNPTTIDRFGNKVRLRDWGTEGQGLPQFPDRKPYSLVQFNLGFGGGVRIDLTDQLQFGTEIFIRKTFTDYIDDVSINSYVDPALFIANGNSYSQYVSYRGDEVGKPFSARRPRGNPKNDDLFYSFQVRLTYRLLGVNWGGPLSFYGNNPYRAKRAMRNPRSVL